MRKNFSKVATVTILLILIIGSCTRRSDPITSNCSVTPSFMADVNPIIQMNCATNAGCHAVGSVNGPGPLTDYLKIKAAASNIKEAVVSRRMPLGASLSNADIETIKCWVEAGAPQN